MPASPVLDDVATNPKGPPCEARKPPAAKTAAPTPSVRFVVK